MNRADSAWTDAGVCVRSVCVRSFSAWTNVWPGESMVAPSCNKSTANRSCAEPGSSLLLDRTTKTLPRQISPRTSTVPVPLVVSCLAGTKNSWRSSGRCRLVRPCLDQRSVSSPSAWRPLLPKHPTQPGHRKKDSEQPHELDALNFDRRFQVRQLPVIDDLSVLGGRRASYAGRSLNSIRSVVEGPDPKLDRQSASEGQGSPGLTESRARQLSQLSSQLQSFDVLLVPNRVRVPRFRLRKAGPRLRSHRSSRRHRFGGPSAMSHLASSDQHSVAPGCRARSALRTGISGLIVPVSTSHRSSGCGIAGGRLLE